MNSSHFDFVEIVVPYTNTLTSPSLTYPQATVDAILKSNEYNMKNLAYVHYKELRVCQKTVTSLQVDWDKAIADQVSTVAEHNFIFKAAIKSAKSTERQHYTERLVTEKAKLTKAKQEIDTYAHLTNVSITNPLVFSKPGMNIC